MVLDAMRLLWHDPSARRNGRRGQRQNGVDVFGRVGPSAVAAQAKNTDELTEAEARAEILKAEQFKPALAEFHFAIAGPRDARFQEFIRMLSAERIAKGQFAVCVLFFDDVCEELAARPELVQKYWGAFIALTAFLDALPKALAGPVLNADAASERIWDLQEFKNIAEYLESASNGQVHANLRVEGVPRLEAPPGALERSWHLTIAETHETHLVTLCRVAVDVDSGRLSFYSVVQDRWLSRDEWLQTGLWFN
jgi:hypothetical protein